MRRPVTLPWAEPPTVVTPFGHSATALAPPAIVAGDLAWADWHASRHGLEPFAAGKTPW